MLARLTPPSAYPDSSVPSAQLLLWKLLRHAAACRAYDIARERHKAGCPTASTGRGPQKYPLPKPAAKPPLPLANRLQKPGQSTFVALARPQLFLVGAKYNVARSRIHRAAS